MKAKKNASPGRRTAIILRASIEQRIYFVRNQKVMIDTDLALLYRVPTKVFNQLFAAIWLAFRRISCSSSLRMKWKT